eukprot:110532-Chlamydomonas_euryale.AAC.3
MVSGWVVHSWAVSGALTHCPAMHHPATHCPATSCLSNPKLDNSFSQACLSRLQDKSKPTLLPPSLLLHSRTPLCSPPALHFVPLLPPPGPSATPLPSCTLPLLLPSPPPPPSFRRGQALQAASGAQPRDQVSLDAAGADHVPAREPQGKDLGVKRGRRGRGCLRVMRPHHLPSVRQSEARGEQEGAGSR